MHLHYTRGICGTLLCTYWYISLPRLVKIIALVVHFRCRNQLGLIALKARAYNDLLERKEIDPRISSKNIDKHKKDIARVLDFISPVEICDLSEYSEIQNDLKKFIVNLEKEHSKKPEIKAGNTTTTVDEIKSSLEKHFGIF